MRKILLFILCICNFKFMFAQYCAGCLIDYTLTSPGVYPTSLPAATAGEYYETDLTFVLAEDTATEFGTFAFLNYYIMEPLGMPYGLHATSDLGDFPVDYDPDVSLYGCVKICGTPLIAGTYSVTVPLIATLEDPAGDQPAEYYLTIEVLPAAPSSGGFSASSTFGCSPTIINFSTGYPSDSVSGYSYFWDFGNGFTSIDENPSPQFYYATDSPTQYIITHTVTIDTVGYSLDYVKVSETNCDDCTIFGCTGLFTAEKPDIYILIDDLSVSTFPGYADTEPPVTFILNVPVDPSASYLLEVKDDDAGGTGSDDNCGDDYFNGDDVGISTIDLGSSTVEISISHPVITLTFYDTIIIYPMPDAPIISISGDLSFCELDSVIISADYNSSYSYQWYNDSAPIPGADSSSYTVFETGNYFLQVTSVGGCADTSAIYPVIVYEYPSGLVITESDNILYTTNEYPVQWYYEGDAIPGANALNYTPAIDGIYSVCATNVLCTTCSPDYPYIFQNIASLQQELFSIYPNPNTGIFNLTDLTNQPILEIEITNVLGNSIEYKMEGAAINDIMQINISNHPNGLYFISIKTDKRNYRQAIIKK